MLWGAEWEGAELRLWICAKADSGTWVRGSGGEQTGWDAETEETSMAGKEGE